MCSPNFVILGDIVASQNKLQLFTERLSRPAGSNGLWQWGWGTE